MTPKIDWRIGVDTGGTFTDVVAVDAQGTVRATHKLLSTPDDPSRAVLEGIARVLESFGAPAASPDVVHGSTVATNALLEGDTQAAALMTTAGFEDVIEIGRQARPDLYALEPRRTAPPVGADRRFGIDERIGFDGSILRALDGASLERAVAGLRAAGVAAVAVCLLHAYANPEHERRVVEALRGAFGDALHVTASHELMPEFREYERTAACVINAAVAPKMVRYLDRLADALGGRLQIMASHGGVLRPPTVRRQPIRTILSGPAGGVRGAADAARAAGFSRAIGFDMGGTSTDVSLWDGEPSTTTDAEAAGLPVHLEMLDIHTVGAGGGSIAWIDAGGALRAGPRSAGADPGPACYGRQRGEPTATVTDAHAVLGHLPPDTVLGEGLAIDVERARAAVGALASRLKGSIEQTAQGICRVAEATMARAIRRISLQRGHDPRDYALVSFGGAGGLHACRLAESLGTTRVLAPAQAGLLSALGMLGAPPRLTFSHATMARVSPDESDWPSWPRIRDGFEALRREAEAACEREGIGPAQRAVHRAIDWRYVGQSHEITVPFDGSDVRGAFVQRHRALYGHAPDDHPMEIVALRLRVDGPSPAVSAPVTEGGGASLTTPRHAPVHDGQGIQSWRRVERRDLAAGDAFDGPAIVNEYSATTLVPPGWSAAVTPQGHLLLQREGGA